MPVTFDPEKDRSNIRERGISFSRAEDFQWSISVVEEDHRRDYGHIVAPRKGKQAAYAEKTRSVNDR